MVQLLEIYQRAQKGRTMSGESFDLDRLYASLTRLVKKYDIKYDPDNPVPDDDALADRVFEAAVGFFVECGVYVQDTRTVVGFSHQEVLNAVANHNGDCRFGEGKEARIFRSRKPDSSTRPWCHVGSGIVASTEEIASRIVTISKQVCPAGNTWISMARSSKSCEQWDSASGAEINTISP